MRTYTYDIHPLIKARWSPRAFDPEFLISEEDLLCLVEAANLAPSAFNAQPRRFLLANKPQDFAAVFSVLDAGNQVWCVNASAFVVILVEHVRENGKNNRWAYFDSGTAFGLMTIQAVSMGLETHAMAGFDRERLREMYDIEERFDPIAVVAVGRYGNKDKLPEALRKKEFPQERKPIQEIVY